MKKILYNLAIGPRYRSHQRITGPFRDLWAARRGWEYEPVWEVPDWLIAGKKGLARKQALDLYKLYSAEHLQGFDLALYSDSDTFMNPNAPDLEEYFDRIPEGGFAAVNVVPYEKRRLFPEWDEDYYVDIERKLGCVVDVPDRTLHMNGGLILFKPRDVWRRWKELAQMESPLDDEQRTSFFEMQNGKCFFLPAEWNVVWQYYVREHLPELDRDRGGTRLMDNLKAAAERTVLRSAERKHLLNLLGDVYMVHLANENRKIGLLKGVDPASIGALRSSMRPKARACS